MSVIAREDRGAWWVFATHQGRRTKRRIGAGSAAKAAAQAVAKTVSAQVALGDLGFFDRRDDTAQTFADYADGWLKTVAGRKKAGTAESYGTVLRLHWLPLIGSTTLRNVRRETIKGQLAAWLTAGAKNGTVRNRLAILCACFEAALDDGKISENPTSKLGKWATRSEKDEAVIEVFTPEELRSILEQGDLEAPWVGTALLVLARTGLRIGEVLTLQWSDLDLSTRQLTVKRTWSGARRERKTNAPKGNRERTVDVSRQCAASLWRQKERTLGVWVFPAEDGEPTTQRLFHAKWEAVLKAAGVRYRKPHTLRHTFATRLIEQGESLAYVQQQLGHSSIKITVDRYGHLVPGGNRAAVDKLDDVEVARG